MKPDTKDIPYQGVPSQAWIAGIKCPYCSSENQHALGAIDPEYFDGNFRQGCFLALALFCEAQPDHLFYFLVGEHKGSIWLETVIPKKQYV